MLKLMKYEFIHSMRTFFIAFAIFLIVCIVDGALAIYMYMNHQVNGNAFFGILEFSKILLSFGIFMTLNVSIFMNFHRSMFQRPAYFTLTIPVSSLQLVVSKVVVSVFWLFVGIFILSLGILATEFFTWLFQTHEMLIETLKQNPAAVLGVYKQFIFLRNDVSILQECLYLLGSLFDMIGTLYFTMSLVHTKWFRKHRILFGILIYFIVSATTSFLTFAVFGSSELLMNAFAPFMMGILLMAGTIYIFDHCIEID